jgi:hypothetical protein
MTNISGKPRFFTILFLFGVLKAYGHDPEAQFPFAYARGDAQIMGHVHTRWDSRYFSEGRDSLDGDSLWASSIELGWKCFAGGIWYGCSPDQPYDELQFTLALSRSIGDFEFHGRYTHLRFPHDDSDDDEIGAGFVWSGLPMKLELAADAYYSFVADGWFAELAATRNIKITDQLSLGCSGIFGLNQGYVPDGHDGANHLAVRLGLEYAVNDSLSITVHTTYSWGLGRDSTDPGDDQLIDFFHGGFGLQWSF